MSHESFKLDSILPVVPLGMPRGEIFYKREYERILSETAETDVPHSIALGVVRANLANRFRHAKNEQDIIHGDPTIIDEYSTKFSELDMSPDASPEDRINAFAAAKYLPSYEVYAAVTLGDATRAHNTSVAEVAFHLLAYKCGNSFETANDIPETRIKVMRIAETPDGEYAVVTTKVDGLGLDDGAQLIEVKSRLSGVVALRDVENEMIVRDFKILAHAAGAEGIPEARVRPFRANIASFLEHTDKYRPIIERAYLTRTRITDLQK